MIHKINPYTPAIAPTASKMSKLLIVILFFKGSNLSSIVARLVLVFEIMDDAPGFTCNTSSDSLDDSISIPNA